MSSHPSNINQYRDWTRSDLIVDEYDLNVFNENARSTASLLSQHTSQARPSPSPNASYTLPQVNLTFNWRASSTMKLLLVSTAFAPLPLIFYLLSVEFEDIRYSGRIVNYVTTNRATTQILVSAAAKIFAGMNVFTFTCFVLFAYRIRLTRRMISLNHLKCARSITSQSIDWDLPVAMLSISALMLIIFAIPNILWNGALTPVITMREQNSMTLETPTYSAESSAVWSYNGLTWGTECKNIATPQGMFGNCPARALQSTLLMAAASATASFEGIYATSATTGYSYIGRSYGAGSSVGIADTALNETGQLLLNYNYTELGYTTRVTCMRNESSDWHIVLIQAGQSEYGIPYIYYAEGMFPNQVEGGGPDFFAVTALDNDRSLAVLGAKAYDGSHIILLTAGEDYEMLNATQCSIEYIPTLFNVNVDVVKKLIQVTPFDDVGDVVFDATGGLASTITSQVNVMAMINTSLYVSIVGEALMANIRATNSTLSEYAAMADSFTAILDQLLLFVARSQLAYSQDSRPAPVTMTIRAVKLGGRPYIIGISSICVVLFFTVMIEAIRTSWWRNLPKFDFTDLRSVITASAAAGEQLLEQSWHISRKSDPDLIGESAQSDNSPRDVRLRVGRRKVVLKDIVRDIVAWWPESGVGYTPLVNS